MRGRMQDHTSEEDDSSEDALVSSDSQAAAEDQVAHPRPSLARRSSNGQQVQQDPPQLQRAGSLKATAESTGPGRYRLQLCTMNM